MSRFDYIYDYKADFPNGNAWCGTHFSGEVVTSAYYRFPKGKYAGKTLQQTMARRGWMGVLKYIDYGCIVLLPSVFDCLSARKDILLKLQTASDAKLTFYPINSVHDRLCSEPFESKHSGESFLFVAENDPDYLLSLVRRSCFPHYGNNQHYYASDNGLSIGNIDSICEELRQEGACDKLVSLLEDYKNRLDEIKEEEERYFQDRYEAEMNRMFLEDAYREAYNYDPDAEWNTY